jgi:hypothetical protein
MGTELTLRHVSGELLLHDFEANLRKGRAFVPGPSNMAERDFCTLCIEAPGGGAPHRVRAEAVWIDAAGTGLSFVDFDPVSQSALRAFIEAAVNEPEAQAPRELDAERDGAASVEPDGDAGPDPEIPPGSDVTPSAGNLHERMRVLDVAQRDVLARQGSLPERVALEQRYGSSVWEGLLRNPQLTPREVLRMAKSASLPATLASSIAANKAWVADGAINQALLSNPRVSGASLNLVLEGLSQADLTRVSGQSSLRMQVRQAAKRLIRR